MRFKPQSWNLLFLLPCVFLYLLQSTHGAFKDEQFLDAIGCSSKTKISIVPNKTLVVKLSRWDEYHRGSSFLNFQCKFQVVAPRGYGIMVTIQQLHLRTKSVQSASCRDYVKFENGDGLEAGPICGEVTDLDTTETPKTLVGPRFFYDPKGNVDVAFKFDESYLDEVQKPFKVELAFTAYAECTSTGLLTRQFRQCSNSRIHSCIASNLFCDGVINCGFRNDFGNDEVGCSKDSPKVVTEPSSTTYQTVKTVSVSRSGKKADVDDDEYESDEDSKHQIGVPVPMHVFAIISAISGGMVVLLVLFICCCIGRSISQRNMIRAHERPIQPPPQIHPRSQIELAMSHMNVPITGIPSSPSTSEAKLPDDLPPSYDAIFPGPVPEKR